ncbi:heavy metal-responsive transcriptional regulator [Elongatibacter sediminis]|uniref:Heavy metal-responsive transcriptional regulator n=1 Tax=Elongatibacter sediminis TaxID=3119006 RepID=A0AAW9RGG6_9GAMM
MSALRIGQLAAETGVTVEAIRYYEQQALIPEAPRSPSGFRCFPPDTVKRVRFIQRAQDLGFSLRDIHGLLGLRNEPGASCAAVKARAEKKLSEVDRKIFELMRIRTALANLSEQCVAQADLGDCPILDALED